MTRRVYLATFLLVLGLAVVTQAQTFTTLYNFTGGSDGGSPYSGLTQDPAGNLYGTAFFGGSSMGGVVFELNTAGNQTVLHSFMGSPDGEYPYTPVARDNAGNIYGTTGFGGSSSAGSVFKIDTAGNETVLYSFTGTSDGCGPSQGLVVGQGGIVFGTTFECGSSDNGTIFEVDSTGRFTLLHSFAGGSSDGAIPLNGHPTMDKSGNLYGATSAGGANNFGVLYELSTSGTLTILHNFAGGTSDGCGPHGSVAMDTSGNIYGTTLGCGSNNYGTIWKVSNTGEETILHDFAGGTSDGCNPYGGVTLDLSGNLYGVTYGCGANASWGALYELSASGTLTLLHSFDNSDGSYPYGEVLRSNGTLYGTTEGGGTTDGFGTVWSYTPKRNTAPALGEQVDYFGEGMADFTVWRPSSGTWYSIDGLGNSKTVPWGVSTDIPIIGDYDGDGKTDVVVWRPSSGTFYVIYSSNGDQVSQRWGVEGDIPVPGDYDGDGKTDYAVFRPSDGTFYIIYSSNNAQVQQHWGENGDIPVPGDYDGDGKTDYAVWRPSNGTFYIILSSTGQQVQMHWGLSTDIPVPGDYDGDGKTDYAVWRPSNGTFYVIYSSTGEQVSKQWGENGDVPVPRDYDGNGKTDYAVWRPSDGTWYVIYSSDRRQISEPWGVSADIPINQPVGQ